MATTIGSKTPKKIHLVGMGRTEEDLAGGAITPGHLLKKNSAGSLIVHGTAGGYAEAAFAVEDALQGKTISDAYASGARVTYVLAAKGDVVYAWLSGGENVTMDEFLTSNGDGTLKVATGSDVVIAAPLENINASDSNDVDERIRVRIL